MIAYSDTQSLFGARAPTQPVGLACADQNTFQAMRYGKKLAALERRMADALIQMGCFGRSVGTWTAKWQTAGVKVDVTANRRKLQITYFLYCHGCSACVGASHDATRRIPSKEAKIGSSPILVAM